MHAHQVRTVCFQCYRAERARRWAAQQADVEGPEPARSRFGQPRLLTPREVAHRQQMLAHLGASSAPFM